MSHVNSDNWFNKIIKKLFDVLDFILGRDDECYEKMAENGKIMMGKMLKKFVEEKKIQDEVKRIHMIGFIANDQKEYEKYLKQLITGRYKHTFQNIKNAVLKDVITIYQIETNSKKFYGMFFLDAYDHAVSDQCLWFGKIKKPLEVYDSNQDYVYYEFT